MSDTTPSTPPRGDGNGLVEWRLKAVEDKVGTIEDEYPKRFATKEEHNETRRILFASIGLAATTISAIFASSFHLFAR